MLRVYKVRTSWFRITDMNFHGKVKLGLLLTLTTLASCTSREEVRIYVPNGLQGAPIRFADKSGKFKSANIVLQEKKGLSDSEAASYLADGKLDAAILPFVTPLFAAKRMIASTAVVAESGHFSEGRTPVLLAHHAVVNGRDLRARTIAVSWQKGSAESVTIRRLLKKFGVDDLETRLVMMKPFEIVRAFKLGSLDAALVVEPWATVIEKNGWAHPIEGPEALAEGLVTDCLVFNREFASGRPHVAQRFIAAYLQGVDISHRSDIKTLAELVPPPVEMKSWNLKSRREITTEPEAAKSALMKTWEAFASESPRAGLPAFSDLWLPLLTKD